MRLAMVSCFDIRRSYGLSDDAFEADLLGPSYPTGMVGLVNPLGRGIMVDLLTSDNGLIRRWCDAAEQQITRPEFEIGFDQVQGETRVEFLDRLKTVIRGQPLISCRVTVFAIGVALLRLDFAYTPLISEELYTRAAGAAQAAKAKGSSFELAGLTARMAPQCTMDVSGYLESDLLAGFRFTYLLLAIDIGDLDLLDQAERFFNIDSTDPNRTVDFEYHGSLRFDGEAYVVQARGLDRWTDVAQPGRDRPDEAVGRMVACVEIAHTFRGACGAFADMLRTETRNLTGGYICEVGAGRSPQELNRLRILTLAVVSLTNFSRVTPIDEDRRYFSLYEQHAMLSEEKQFIQESCELLYNALQAELQWQQSKQDRLLGYFLAGLTSLTLISVLADAYSFVSGQNEALIQQRLQRMTLLLALVLLSATLVLLVVRPGNRRTHRQASFPVSRFPSADSKRFRRRRRQRTVQSRSGESP